MPVRILAFFDTRYQTTADFARLNGHPDPWFRLRDVRPVSRQHGALNSPGTLGFYDIADPSQAARLVGLARQVGLDGLIVDLRPLDEGYRSGAEPLAPYCSEPGFAIGFRWRAQSDLTPAKAAALIAAMQGLPMIRVDGCPLLLVETPDASRDLSPVLALLQSAARQVGLPGLYHVANRAEFGRLDQQGFAAALDPDPAEWASCAPSNKPSGLDRLEIEAGLRDSVEMTDKFYAYALFVVSRMIRRETRGKVFPRVFPTYQDWPLHLDGGATLLQNGGSGGGVDRYLFGLFIENAMIFAHETFAPDERLVFLESWNGWMEGTQIEPSLFDGDLVYNATRNAIDKARYQIQTRGEPPLRRLDPQLHDMIGQICAAAAAVNKAAS